MFRIGRSIRYLTLFGASTVTLYNINVRYRDYVTGDDQFAEHTRTQIRKHRFTGMHEPFITNNEEQLNRFHKYFPDLAYLLPNDMETITSKNSLKTPVSIKALNECPNAEQILSRDKQTIVVGGPPALVPGVEILRKEKRLVYINDERRIPISYGSAWHLEQDAETEAPTSYLPSQFIIEQMKRILFSHVTHNSVQETGHFPWRTLDWFAWIKHPEHWLAALKVTIGFQITTMFNDRGKLLNNVAEQCRFNETFFQDLNQEMKGKLLSKESGAIIVARNTEEEADLHKLKNDLENEKRTVRIVAKDELIKRCGFIPNGKIYGEKVHDRTIVANFIDLLKNYLKERGADVLSGTVTTIYANDKKSQGIVEYETSSGEKHFVPYSRLIMSLGSQKILKNSKPLFDIVAARGVSVLAHVYVPTGSRLPSALVCGGTNHMTKLVEQPKLNVEQDGKTYDLYLVRITAGACITPNVCDNTTANYDGTIALGLISAVRKTVGDQFKVEPIHVYGCNRQVSRNGQIGWLEPAPGVHIQYGAAGGGLTRAPDFATKL